MPISEYGNMLGNFSIKKNICTWKYFMSEMHAILLFRGESSQCGGDLFEHLIPTSKHHYGL